jgi:acyl-CoA thioesterase-1
MNTGSKALVLRSQSPRSPHSAEPLVRTYESFPKIVAFGNSLTAGLGVAPDESYPAQLAQRLLESGFQYEVINAGVSGETSAGGVRRIEWILKSQPTVVILELGVNDGLRGLPLKQTYTNLHTIIERLKAEGVMVILAGMRIPVNYGEDYTGEFFEMYERLAQEFALPLIPFFLEGVAAQPGLNQVDGVHPTGEGYTIVTQNVWHTLEPILKELSESLKKS